MASIDLSEPDEPRLSGDSAFTANSTQDLPRWSNQCGENHWLELYHNNSDLLLSLKGMNYSETKIKEMIISGNAVILEHLPYRKQVRVRAAIGFGQVSSVNISGSIKTLVLEGRPEKNFIIDYIFKLIAKIKLKDILSTG